MDVTSQQRDLLALCAIQQNGQSIDRSLIARSCQSADGLDNLMTGRFPEDSPVASQAAPVLRVGLNDLNSARAIVEAELVAARNVGAHLVTVLDEHYPANLRLVPNLPPFLFYQGQLCETDARSVAVVGARAASPEGRSTAAQLARDLVEHEVTVVSGLAKGIDTAAHTAALDAGGRTIAVMGTGVAAAIYPAENRDLADRILQSQGALLSQFWPTSPPAKWTFPQRNIVTSGLTMGSVIIEASSTAGSRLQAQNAYEHGKQVFLISGLATSQPWAARMVAERRGVEVTELADILRQLGTAERVLLASQQRHQLALAGL